MCDFDLLSKDNRLGDFVGYVRVLFGAGSIRFTFRGSYCDSFWVRRGKEVFRKCQIASR